MIWIAASLVIQILFVLHAHRTGREQIWTWIILIFSLPGCFAYFVFELMPEMIGPNSPRAIERARKEAYDPFARLKAAEAALEKVDTAANRIALGDAQAELGAHGEAAEQYRRALGLFHSWDPKLELKLADTLLSAGEAKEALRLVDRVAEEEKGETSITVSLLRARALSALDRAKEAFTLWRSVIDRGNDEARCHFALALIDAGEVKEAQPLLETVCANWSVKRTDDNAAMYKWAAETLAKLRRG